MCDSDLHLYATTSALNTPSRIGHDFIDVVEDVGADVTGVRRGDLVVVPSVSFDGTCIYGRNGLNSACEHGGAWVATRAATARRARRSACPTPLSHRCSPSSR